MSRLLGIDEILFNVSPGETRAALVADGRLIELLIERGSSGSLVSNVYLGRVGKLVPSMEAAFVDIGAGRAGFLARDDARTPLGADGAALRPWPDDGPSPAIGQCVGEGEAVLVQVVKDAFGQKGPRLSTQITLAGHWLVLSPTRRGISISRRITAEAERARLDAAVAPLLGSGEGLILRTAAEGMVPEALEADLARLRERWRATVARARAERAPALVLAEPDMVSRTLRDGGGPALRRVVCDDRDARARAKAYLAAHGQADAVDCVLHQGPEPIFARHDIDDQIAEALEPVVELPSGGSLVIGTLEALTAIDVNTGRQAGPGRFADTILAVNLEAAAEIAHQVRLRNLAGLIVIDFVHMDVPAHRARVIEALRAGFAGDPVAVQLGTMTPLGLYEMTRKRARDALGDTLGERCGACHGTGRVKSAETVALELLRAAERAAAAAPGRPVIAFASAAVAAALDAEAKAARVALEAEIGRPLALRVEQGYGRDQFDLVTG